MLFTDAGKVVRFNETKVRCMGRQAAGVRGVKLQDSQRVVSLVICQPGGDILTATENGYGKRTEMDEYRQSAVVVRALFPFTSTNVMVKSLPQFR